MEEDLFVVRVEGRKRLTKMATAQSLGVGSSLFAYVSIQSPCLPLSDILRIPPASGLRAIYTPTRLLTKSTCDLRTKLQDRVVECAHVQYTAQTPENQVRPSSPHTDSTST